MRALVLSLWLLPRNILIATLSLYRKVVSPLYGDVCRYYPSCSSYTLTALQQYGVVRGVAMGTWRILRCNPWSDGGVDDVPARPGGSRPVSRWGFVRRTTAAPQVMPQLSPQSFHQHADAHSHGKG